MKVLFFIGQLQQGGAERVISIISGKLAEKGFNVEILVYYDREINYEIDNRVKVTIVERENKTINKLKNLLWIRDYLNKNTDIVISFLAPFNILALLANPNKPIIVADRNDPRKIPTNCFVRKLRDLLYKKANVVVVQTKNNKDYFNYLENVTVIGNPIDLGENKGRALKTKKEKIITSAGRLKKQKNQKMLIEAFGEIVKKHSEYKLVIYGEGEHRQELERTINDLELNNKVFLPGETTRVFEEISKAEIFVLSSNYEGMPNALIEAMCLGLPCISTNVSGSSELIKDGVNGYLIDINDKKTLINKLEKMIENTALRNVLATNAVEINKELNVDYIVAKWIEIINRFK